MLGVAGNVGFFRVSGGSVAEKSWLACATVSGAAALAGKCFQTAHAVELMVPGEMMQCCCGLHVLRHFVHWNCCIEERSSLLDLLEFEGSPARKLRFHVFICLQLLEFEGSLARKLRFHESWMRFEC